MKCNETTEIKSFIENDEDDFEDLIQKPNKT